MEHEELMDKLIVQADAHLAVKDHVDLVERLAPVDYSLSRDVQAAVERGDEEGDEFVTSVI